MARTKKSTKKDRMTISFTEFDEDVFDFLDDNRNASALVRFLVRNYMNGVVTTAPSSYKVEPKKEEIIEPTYVKPIRMDKCVENDDYNEGKIEQISNNFRRRNKTTMQEKDADEEFFIKKDAVGSKKIDFVSNIDEEEYSKNINLVSEIDL